MDDLFDRLLERDLARMLNPIVETPAPRRRRPHAENPLRAIAGGLASTVPVEVQALPEVVPVIVVIPAAPVS
jgi:hypothetical protein